MFSSFFSNPFKQAASLYILVLLKCSYSLQRQVYKEDDRFATIRPQNIVARQVQEHKQGNDQVRDQMQVYKHMRQQHQKQLQALESKLQTEMNDHRRALDKEYDSQVHQFERELEKIRARQKTEMEQKVCNLSGIVHFDEIMTEKNGSNDNVKLAVVYRSWRSLCLLEFLKNSRNFEFFLPGSGKPDNFPVNS